MLRNDTCLTNIRQAVLDVSGFKIQTSEKKTIMRFSVNVSIKRRTTEFVMSNVIIL